MRVKSEYGWPVCPPTPCGPVFGPDRPLTLAAGVIRGSIEGMPIYEYRCARCGDFEQSQRITDPPLDRCPTCRRKVRRLISSTSFQLKGSGWYVTDYPRPASGNGAKKDESDSTAAESKAGDKTKSDDKAKPDTKAKSDTKAASKAASKAESKAAPASTSEKPSS
jgi:putative FmdB family regulatory protein